MQSENQHATSQIRLLDLIRLAGVELSEFKIHLATESSSSPIDTFLAGKFKEYQEWQNKNNFKSARVLSLLQMSGADWLFAGVWEVHGHRTQEIDNKKWFVYQTSEVPGLEHLVGRTIIYFPRKFRSSYIWGGRYGQHLLVKEILPLRLTIGDFPGYNRFCLTFDRLKLIIGSQLKSWQGALSAVGGVYVIADTKTGKLYVGSAYGEGGFWQRWSSYVESGHGGNKQLVGLIAQEGVEYCQGFRFSILEIMDLKESAEHAISRENHWKEVLLTKPFGLNSN